ncbi:unnamed protein product, partial [marine sediment metagenome]
ADQGWFGESEISGCQARASEGDEGQKEKN